MRRESVFITLVLFFFFLNVSNSFSDTSSSSGLCLNPTNANLFCQQTSQNDCCGDKAGERVCQTYFYDNIKTAPTNLCFDEKKIPNYPVCFNDCSKSINNFHSPLLCADSEGKYTTAKQGIDWDYKESLLGLANCGQRFCVKCGPVTKFVYPGEINQIDSCTGINMEFDLTTPATSVDDCLKATNYQKGTYTLSGKVFQPDGKTPVFGALVSAYGAKTTSTVSGSYTLSGLFSGTYNVIASAQNFESGSAQVTFPNQKSPTNIILSKSSFATIKVTVVDADKKPITNALVTISSTDFEFSLLSENGVVVFPLLKQGSVYTISADYNGDVQELPSTNPLSAGLTEFTIQFNQMQKVGTITVNVKDEKKNDFEGVSVSLDTKGTVISTDVTGSAKFIDLPFQTYSLTVSKTGYASVTKEVIVSSTDVNPSLSFNLIPVTQNSAILIVQFTNKESVNPVEVHIVESDLDGQTDVTKKSLKEINGNAVLFTLPTGKGYTIHANKEGYLPVDGSITLDKDTTVELFLESKKDASISGTIKKKGDGKVINGQKVNEFDLTKDELKHISVFATNIATGAQSTALGKLGQLSSGIFSFQTLAQGTYQLVVLDDNAKFQSVTQLITLTQTDKNQDVKIILSEQDCNSQIQDPLISSVDSVTGKNQVTIAYNVSCSPRNTKLLSCITDVSGTCSDEKANWLSQEQLYPSENPNVIQTSVPANKRVCYKISAHYPFEKEPRVSAFDEALDCITTGDQYCFDHHDEEFCNFHNREQIDDILHPTKITKPYYRWQCDSKNKLTVVEKKDDPILKTDKTFKSAKADYSFCEMEKDFSVDQSNPTDPTYEPACRFKCRKTVDDKTEYYDTKGANCRVDCNSVFGIFGGSTDTSGFLKLDFQNQKTNCFSDWLITVGTDTKGAKGDLDNYCYYDSSFSFDETGETLSEKATTINTHEDCSRVTSCYDFKSTDACTTHARCGYAGMCEWKESSYFGSIGVGVCRPKEETKQDCSKCRAGTHYNPLLSDCLFDLENGNVADIDAYDQDYLLAVSKSHCELFGSSGSCYFANAKTYDAKENGEIISQQCMKTSDAPCEFADSQKDCTGGSNVRIDTQYDSSFGDLAVSGTNAITKLSKGIVGKGLCIWNEKTSSEDGSLPHCVKDADGNGKADCPNLDSNCIKDTTPPVTIVEHADTVREFTFLVTVYTDAKKTEQEESSETYFGFSQGTKVVYPKTQIDGNEIVVDMEPNGIPLPDGEYTFSYYSKDTHNNLEKVKTFTVILDRSFPLVDISYDKNLLAQSNVALITLSANEAVRCDASLDGWFGTEDIAHVVPSFPDNTEVTENISFVEQTDGTFTLTKLYSDLHDGVYVYTVNCKDDLGNTAPEQKVYLKTGDDSQIFEELPQGIINTTQTTLSVRTYTDAECRYIEAGVLQSGKDISFDSMTNSFQTRSIDGGTYLHTQEITANIKKPFNKYFVKCKLADMNNVDVNNPDINNPDANKIVGKNNAIIFGIDTIAPQSSVYDGILSTDFTKTLFDSQKYHQAIHLQLGCIDPSDPSKQYSFGCANFLTCAVQGLSCLPDENGLRTLTNGVTYEIPFDDTTDQRPTVFCYNARDLGGNTENQKCIPLHIDTIPPKVSAETTLNQKTNHTSSPFVTITGKSYNYAFWIDDETENIYAPKTLQGIYTDYTLHTKITQEDESVIKPVEIIFDQSADKNSYYILSLFGSGNKAEVYSVVNGESPVLVSSGSSSSSSVLSYVASSMNVEIKAIGKTVTITVGNGENTPLVIQNRAFSGGAITLKSGIFSDVSISSLDVSPIAKIEFLVNGKMDSTLSGTMAQESFTQTVDLNNDSTAELSDGTEFTITVKITDEAGNSYEKNLPAIFDSVGPDEPTIEPILDVYPSLGYPFVVHQNGNQNGNSNLNQNTNVNQVYSQNKSVFISGFTNEPFVNLSFLVGLKENMLSKQSVFQEKESIAMDNKFTKFFKTQAEIEENQTSFVVSVDLTPVLKAGMYIQFSEKRLLYKKYNAFYKIASVSYEKNTGTSSSGTTIIVSEPLEKTISKDTQFFVFPEERESTWFGQNIDLLEGINYLRIDPFDELGNLGHPTDVQKMIVDSVSPVQGDNMYPKNSWIISSLKKPVQFLVIESGTGLDFDNTFLLVNDVGTDLIITIDSNKTLTNGRTEYIYNVTVPSLDSDLIFFGEYNLSFFAQDFAGNTLHTNWSFTINPDSPAGFDVIDIDNKIIVKDSDGNTITDPSGKLYVDAWPDNFTIVNLDNISLINISYIDIIVTQDDGKEVDINISGYSCTKQISEQNQIDGQNKIDEQNMNPNTFFCKLPNIDDLIKDYNLDMNGTVTFEVDVHSQKLLNDSVVDGNWKFDFISDKEKPLFELIDFLPNGIMNTSNLVLELKSTNEANGLFAIVTFTNKNDPTDVYTTTVLLGEGILKEGYYLYSGVILAKDLPNPPAGFDKTYDITITVSDYAGNTNTIHKDVIFDNTPPTVDEIHLITDPIYQQTSGNFIVKGDTIAVAMKNISLDVEGVVIERTGGKKLMYDTMCTGPIEFDCLGKKDFTTSPIAVLISESVNQKTYNLVTFTLTDKAGNTNTYQRSIKKDTVSPILQEFCLGLPQNDICVKPTIGEEIQKEAIVNITKAAIVECDSNTQDISCYLDIVQRSCANKNISFTLSHAECVTSRVIKLANPDLFPLCDEAKAQADNCYCMLGRVTSTPSLFDKMTKSGQDACKASQTDKNHPYNKKIIEYQTAKI